MVPTVRRDLPIAENKQKPVEMMENSYNSVVLHNKEPDDFKDNVLNSIRSSKAKKDYAEPSVLPDTSNEFMREESSIERSLLTGM